MTKQIRDDEFDRSDRQNLTFEKFGFWNSEAAETLNELLRALRRKKGFGLFFVQCNPSRGEQIIKAIRGHFPEKRVVQFELDRQSETLYENLLECYRAERFEIACVTGVEQALYDYEDTKRLAGWSSEEIYNYSWKGVPPLLSHLNRQREAIEENLPISLIFLVRSFAIDYFIQRAPDFFDWRSGFFKFLETYKKAQKEPEKLLEKYFQEYLHLTSNQRIEKILEIKDKIRQVDPSNFDRKSSLLLEQGRLFESNKDFQEALNCYDLALRVNFNSYDAWHSRGGLLHILEQYEKAIESYDRALEIKPDLYFAWTNRGNALRSLERYKEAIESYYRALKIKPDFHYAWNGRGNAFNHLERYEKAIESYDRALELEPNSVYGWTGRGIALWNNRGNTLIYLSKQPKKKITSLHDHVLEIQPNFHDSENNQNTQLKKAIHYEKIVKNDNLSLIKKTHDLCVWSKKEIDPYKFYEYEEVIKSYDKALEIQPNYYPAYMNKGFVLYQLGKHEEASNCFAEVAKIQDIQCVTEMQYLRYALNNQGYLELAQYSYGFRPIVFKPLLIRNSQIHIDLSKDDIFLVRCQKALELFNSALNADPEQTLAWANQSFPSYYLKQYQNALKSCNKALEIDPENKEEMNEVVYTNRGCILLKLENPTAALQDFTAALAIDPKLDEAWNGHGTALYQLGRYVEAIESFTRAADLNHPLAKTNLNLTQKQLDESVT
ncbi:tetratricopeptide repeat protein [Baaleninema simplex]|uniref:tetratricopeptide repeat protein n=1 Tax=Baaleninema simplex TaxID=2862350 RepID=UPI00034C3B8D|nr:tetratricopeptide repeat protein [Baaleninema simplex]